jgi:hypothetical protein
VNGAAGAGIDLNFHLSSPDQSNLFEGNDWNRRKAASQEKGVPYLGPPMPDLTTLLSES